jgi:hypothetical protein
MKRKQNIFVLFFLALSLYLNGQTVDSVVAEQVGDLVKIRYKILNSTSDQLFKVTILCAINGGLKSELNNTFGDLGEVRGGKTEYTIVWDVLKDVDELQSADFFVRAEMIKEKETPVVIYQVQPQPVKNKDYASHLFFVWAGSPNNGNTWGIRYGYLKKIGISVHFSFGLKVENEISWDTKIHPLMYSGVDFTYPAIFQEKNSIIFTYGYGLLPTTIGKELMRTILIDYLSFSQECDFGSIIDIGRFTSSLSYWIFPSNIYSKQISDQNLVL